MESNNNNENGYQAFANTVAHDILYGVFINQLDDILDGKQNSTFTHADDFQQQKFQSILKKTSDLLQLKERADQYRQMIQNARDFWKEQMEKEKPDENINIQEATQSFNTYAFFLKQFDDIMGIENPEEIFDNDNSEDQQ